MCATSVRPSRWQFLAAFLRDPWVASVAPTSSAAVRRICQPIDFSRTLTIVELGPGNGAFTRYVCSRLSAASRLLAIERNPQFAAELQSIPDRRLTVVNDSAERLSEIVAREHVPAADAVISGIPFSFFASDRQEHIMRQVASNLKPGGRFIIYQFSSHVGSHLRTVFPRVRQFRIWRNLPPLVVYAASPR